MKRASREHVTVAVLRVTKQLTAVSERKSLLLRTRCDQAARGTERPITCFVCGRPGHLPSACPDRAGGSGAAAVKEVQVCERNASRSTLTESSGEPVSFSFDSGFVCSLVTKSYAGSFPGAAQGELVYLTGIDSVNVKCVSQVISSINVQGPSLSILFHIVHDNNTIAETVILGNNVHVH